MIKSKKSIIVLLVAILSLSLYATGCGKKANTPAAPPKGSENVNTDPGQLVVYSSRNERFTQELLDKFSADTGIKVLPLHGAKELQIVEEARNVQADIFISNDLGALGYLHLEGLLQGANPKGIETIPANFRSDDNAYIAISLRARGFIYNKDLITEKEMPRSAEDLFDPKWAQLKNGYAITRGGNGGMIGHVSALRYEWGDAKTAEWIDAIRKNSAGIYQGHSEIRKAVGAGEHTFGLVNNYYFHQQLLEPTNNNVGFIYLDQGQGQMGAVANAAGVGLVKGGPNGANAIAFLEWLLLPENQAAFVGASLELLINSQFGAVYPPAVQPHIIDFKDLKLQNMPIKELGNYFQDTRALIEASGLDLDLK
ncbi:MAG: extracellular solute-binding protein [Dethiobacter sp.]|jgi:iron(III) transport system substrate-binding protein|nr:extracellular solute-binding protein [Dethiobacter sp.]